MYSICLRRNTGNSKINSARWGAKLLASIAFVGSLLAAPICAAQVPTPEILHYKFNGAGTTVTNHASSPPVGTASATMLGGLTQGGSLTGTYLSAVVGSGASSATDYVNTGWATNLSGSWSISFFTSDIVVSVTPYYVMGDSNPGQIRIFTNGVAGPNNWILRGSFTDTILPGGAVTGTTMNTFVYDSAANEIRAYLNGVLVSTVAQAPGVVVSGAGPFKVAGYGGSSGLNAGGKLGDFRIYSHALTPTEITAIYNAAFTPPPPAVPTLSEWAFMLLGLLMAASGALWLQRRRYQL